jgi:hypothetical protein
MVVFSNPNYCFDEDFTAAPESALDLESVERAGAL